MKRIITSLLLACLSFLATAQYAISGKVFDNNELPMGYVTVLLLSPTDSSLVKGEITSEEGLFTLNNVEQGDYILSFQFINYQDNMTSISVDANKDLGTFKMIEDVTTLETIEVTARKPLFERQIDRLVVNVGAQISSAGGSAIEILQKSPGVILDRQRNLISLSGKEGVLIMINGKVSRQPISSVLSMLEGMSAENIEKIELITTPPSKYDAGGNAGLINIVLKKREDLGTNGSYSVTVGYGKKDKQGANINLNNRKNKTNWFGDFSFNRNHGYEIYTNDRSIIENNETLLFQTISNRDPISTNLNGRIGLDLEVTPKTTLGFLVSGFSNTWDMEAVNKGFGTDDLGRNFFEIDNTEKNQWSNLMGNFNVRQSIEKGFLDFDIDYLYYFNDNPTTYDNQFLDAQDNLIQRTFVEAEKQTPVTILVPSLDFSRELGGQVNLELGLKGIFSSLDNDVLVSDRINGQLIPNMDLSENASLLENILAAYTSVSYSIDEKTKMILGLRYEYTDAELNSVQDGKIVDLEYDNLFPSFFISRKLNDDWQSNFSYGRRITRPSYNDLAPFVIFIDPNTFFFGNTALQPSISDNLEVNLNYKSYMLSVQYAYDNDGIARYQPTLLEDTNQQVFTSLNLKYRTTLFASLSLPFQLTDWWNIRNNLMGISRRIETKENEKIAADFFRLNVDNSFTLAKGFSMTLSGFYQSESGWGIAKESALWNVNAGIQKKMVNGARLTLSVNNIFGFNYDVFTASGLNQNYFTNTNYLYEPHIFRLTYTNTFGNDKLKDQRRRSTGSESIKRRVN